MQEQKKLACLCNLHFLLARLARQEQSHSELTRHQLTNPFHFEAVALPPPPSPRPTSPYRDDSGTKMRTRDARCSIPLARSASLHHMHPAVASLDKLGRAQPVQCLRSPQLLISAIVAWSIIVLFDANFVLSRAMCHDTSIALVPALRRFSNNVQEVHLTEVSPDSRAIQQSLRAPQEELATAINVTSDSSSLHTFSSATSWPRERSRLELLGLLYNQVVTRLHSLCPFCPGTVIYPTTTIAVPCLNQSCIDHSRCHSSATA